MKKKCYRASQVSFEQTHSKNTHFKFVKTINLISLNFVKCMKVQPNFSTIDIEFSNFKTLFALFTKKLTFKNY